MQEKNDLDQVEEIDSFTVFVKNSVDYINKNRNYFILGLIIFIAVLFIVSYIPVYLGKKETLSFHILQKSIDAANNKKNPSPEDINSAFKPLFDEHKGSKAYGYGCIYAGRKMIEAKDKKKAAELYKKAVDFFGDSSLPGSLAEYELGCVTLDRDSKNSSKYFKNLFEKDSFLKAESLFYLGLAGDTKSFEILKEEYPDNFYSNLAEEKYFGLKQKN